jgi:uncharacterized protein (TIGR04141 family)
VNKFSVLFDITTSTLDSFSFESNGSLIEGVIKYSEVGGKRKTQRDYPWMSMVNGLSNDINFKFSTTNKTPSAVVGIKITKQSNREVSFFILTFGMHTSRFINIDKLVNDFGIKVAMNICDPNKLRKVNTTTHSSTSTLTDRQASRGASLDIFDIDDDKEFFRSISGYTHADYDFIKSFSGRSSIQIKFSTKALVDNDDLISTLQKLDTAYKSDSYKENFPTYGRLDFVSDNDEIKQLDDLLFSKLKSKELSSIHLSPNFIEDDNHNFYSYIDSDRNADIHIELDINDLLNEHPQFNVKSSIGTVKKWKIYSKSDTEELDSFKAYDCINCEIEKNEKTYILSGGLWRSVNTDFKSQIEEYIKNKIKNNKENYLPNDVSIHCINEKGEDKYKEEVYNSHVAIKYDDIYHFDKSKIKIAGKKQYEICDLFHKNKEFIHVKVFKSGTSSLSHLFLQARFYTDAFVKDEITRSSIREFINKNDNVENWNKDKKVFLDLIPQDRKSLHASSFSIVVCILTYDENKNIENLPFMAKYELAKTHKYLIEERGIELAYAIRLVNKNH